MRARWSTAMRNGVPLGRLSAILAACGVTRGISSSLTSVAGAQVETSASSSGASPQPAEFEPDCASAIGAYSNTGTEKERAIRARCIGWAFGRVIVALLSRERLRPRRLQSENITRWTRRVYLMVVSKDLRPVEQRLLAGSSLASRRTDRRPLGRRLAVDAA